MKLKFITSHKLNKRSGFDCKTCITKFKIRIKYLYAWKDVKFFELVLFKKRDCSFFFILVLSRVTVCVVQHPILNFIRKSKVLCRRFNTRRTFCWVYAWNDLRISFYVVTHSFSEIFANQKAILPFDLWYLEKNTFLKFDMGNNELWALCRIEICPDIDVIGYN